MSLHTTVYTFQSWRISSAAPSHTLPAFLYVGHPAERPRWRPSLSQWVIQVHTSVSGFLRSSFIIRIIFSTMSCVFFWSAAAPAAVVLIASSTLLILVCWLTIDSCSVAALDSSPLVWSRMVSTSFNISRFIS